MFACMNPANDVGKKDLPAGIRNRFTEIFVNELHDVSDLKTLVHNYLQGLSPPGSLVDDIVRCDIRDYVFVAHAQWVAVNLHCEEEMWKD